MLVASNKFLYKMNLKLRNLFEVIITIIIIHLYQNLII